GHHFRSDSFLNMFREALRSIVGKDHQRARNILERLDPKKHEAFTHVWLEMVRANGSAFPHLFIKVLESPHLVDAGWDGAEWKSFADAAKEVIPYLDKTHLSVIESKILAHW